MANISKFEELVAWQKARVMTAEIYRVSEVGAFDRDFGLKDQIRRAAVSTTSNIAEGFERMRPAEFHQMLSIAKGSCGEVRPQLYVALDAGHLDQRAFEAILEKVEETGRVIGGLRASVEAIRDRDAKS